MPQKQDNVEMKKNKETNKAQSPFRIRGRLPPRKQEVRKESENPSNDRKPFEHGRIRGRILPKSDQKKTPVLQEEPTTKKSFGFNPSRLRSRLIPKIDPRGKQAEDSKSPAVSVSVSHSVSSTVPELKTTTATVPQNVLLLTTTAQPNFNLVEPEGAVASTESYLGGKVGAPLVVTQQPDSA